MANIRRKDILQALQTRLEELTTENGYTFNVCEVSYDWDNYQEKAEHELPAIYILPDTEVHTGGVGGRYDRTMILDLFIVTKNITYPDLMDMVDDIESVLVGPGGTRSGLGCNINLCRVVEWAVQNQMNHDTDGYAIGVVTIELVYRKSAFTTPNE